MAIVTKEELLSKINGYIPEGAEDLSILEDISDTYDDLASKANTDWEGKYNEAITAYRTRFTEGAAAIDVPAPEPDEPTGPTTFEELFKEED